MRLNPEKITSLKAALSDAFPTYGGLRLMVAEGQWAGKEIFRLEDITPPSERMPVVILDLVEWAERLGQIEYLVRNATRANATNDALATVARNDFPFISQAGVPPGPSTTTEAAPTEAGVLPSSVISWEQLESLRRAVCLVESSLGTTYPSQKRFRKGQWTALVL